MHVAKAPWWVHDEFQGLGQEEGLHARGIHKLLVLEGVVGLGSHKPVVEAHLGQGIRMHRGVGPVEGTLVRHLEEDSPGRVHPPRTWAEEDSLGSRSLGWEGSRP